MVPLCDCMDHGYVIHTFKQYLSTIISSWKFLLEMSTWTFKEFMFALQNNF